VPAEQRRQQRDQEQRIREADDADEGERSRPSVTDLLQPPPRSLEGKRQQERDLGAYRDQPDPPGQPPERPVLHLAHAGEHQLHGDHQRDRWSRLPPRLDLLLAERFTVHRGIVTCCGRQTTR
jgi:hypothetical protein